MKEELTATNRNTLKGRILSMPEGSVLFRSDFPEYHSEFVGSTLAELTAEGVLKNWRKAST